MNPTMDARVPYTPPGALAPADEASGLPGWVPEWVPTLSPEAAAVGAAVLGLVSLGALLVVLFRRRPDRSGPRPVLGPDGEPVIGPDGKPLMEDGPDPWVRRIILALLVAAPIMLGLTFYGSFHAVQELAVDNGYPVDQSHIPPLAIDGMLLVLLLFDLLFARLNTPNVFVKYMTRLFIWFTLVANAAAGWPEPIAIFLHVPAPLAIVVMTEVSRQALLRDAQQRQGKGEFDPIPFMRWVLAPRSTFGIWRWMILQDVRSYAAALAADHDRRDALAIIAAGPDETVPAYLTRRLRDGMDVSATAARVRALAGVDEAAPAVVDAPVDAEPVRSAGPVHPADAPDAVQVDSTGPSTPRVDAAPAVVDDRVDAVVDEAAPQGSADAEPAPAPAVASTPDEAPAAARVDAADTSVHPAPSAAPVHLDEAWTAPSVHPAPGADGVDEAARAYARRAFLVGMTATDGDDEGPEDPDDDGPRGGGVPAPGPLVAAGHTGGGAYDAGEPSRSQVRDAVDTARWEDAVSKKSKVMALLTIHMGDAAAVMADYRTRTGEDAPKSDIYRSGPRGYAWTWHHTAASRLVRRQGDVDVVRGILRDAGVDADHPGVVSALDEWAAANSHVVPFRRHVPQGT